MRKRSLRLHVFKIYDGSIVGNKGRSKWNQRVFHPEALPAACIEFEQHAFLLRHFGAIHEPCGMLVLGSRNLHQDLVNAYGQGRLWQFSLGQLRCCCSSKPERQSKDAKVDVFHKGELWMHKWF